ncbi:hypothetical protein C7A11_12865 [Pseudomonas simiae]|nr:hypothetical protein C7A11_12865 [Pseudomonas simiae]
MAMEREMRMQDPAMECLWDPDHNAPALLDLLPASEQLAAGEQLGWRLEMSFSGQVSQTPFRTPNGFIWSWTRSRRR